MFLVKVQGIDVGIVTERKLRLRVVCEISVIHVTIGSLTVKLRIISRDCEMLKIHGSCVRKDYD